MFLHNPSCYLILSDTPGAQTMDQASPGVATPLAIAYIILPHQPCPQHDVKWWFMVVNENGIECFWMQTQR